MSAPLSLPGLTQFLSRLEDYPRLLEAVDQGKQTIALSGLSAVHRAYLAAALHQSTGRPLTLVCPTTERPGVWRETSAPSPGRRCRFSPPGTSSFTPGPPPASGSTSAWKFWPGSTGGTVRCWWPPWRACSSGPCPRGLRRQLPPAPCGPGLSAGGAHRLSGSGGVHPVRPGGGGQGSSPCGGAFWTSSPPAWTCRCGWNFGG